ncbi:mitochondrial ribosomal small subunit component [Tulasnella sp. 331]|nr:mitochondrial ribosomal small subunit component [Tulasnella sp. 331]
MVVHHASTIAVIPQCEAGSILIDMYSMAKSLKPADRRRIVPADMQVEDSSLANDGFVGTVVAVGRDVRGETFIAGDYVGGYVNGGKWIETLDGSNKGPYFVAFPNLRESLATNSAVYTQARACTILPNFIGIKFMVHNGMQYLPVTITPEMVGHKLGEFSPTRKRFTYKPSKNK